MLSVVPFLIKTSGAPLQQSAIYRAYKVKFVVCTESVAADEGKGVIEITNSSAYAVTFVHKYTSR